MSASVFTERVGPDAPSGQTSKARRNIAAQKTAAELTPLTDEGVHPYLSSLVESTTDSIHQQDV